MSGARVGLFTRLLEQASAAERYEYALQQIDEAERLGFHSAWIAQHHFHEHEGGLPSPLVLLAAAAQRTSRIRLGTGIITLPLENPIRVAEDAAVADLLSGGRLEIGVGSGGNPTSFAPFGQDFAERREVAAAHIQVLADAWTGRPVGAEAGAHAGAGIGAGSSAPADTRQQVYPSAPTLERRVWQATFSASGAARAGQRGDGLLLSRTQPRPEHHPDATLYEIQAPVVEAYHAALAAGDHAGESGRILASRTLFVVDDEHRELALQLTERGLRAAAPHLIGPGAETLPFADLVRLTDTHVGTVDDVVASLGADHTLQLVTDVAFQVHSVPATHELTLRSLQLIAEQVAPALGLGLAAGA